MIAGLRRVHRWAWPVLALVLGVLLTLALTQRPGHPAITGEPEAAGKIGTSDR